MNIATAVADPHKVIDETPMTSAQIAVVALAVFIAGMDGYDALSMAFVAPVVSKVWAIDKTTLGMLLASNLFGMAGGSLALAPVADIFGRRPVLLGALLIITLGSLLSALSHSVMPLAASRILTGLGIGVMVSLTTSVAAEFSNIQRRSFAVATTTVGFAVGSTIGGFTAAAILKAHDWHWVFGIGAIIGIMMTIIAAIGLPESPAFLLARRPKKVLDRLNRVLVRLKREPFASLPPSDFAASRVSYRVLFSRDVAPVTLRFVAVNMLFATASYYLLSWLPQLVASAGFPPATANLVSASASVFGIVGGLSMGFLAAIVGPTRVAATSMFFFGVALAAIGLVPPQLLMLFLAAGTCGFFMSSATAVFLASMVSNFPPSMRVSAIGLVLGVARLTSGLGPFFAGVMFTAGLTRMGVSLIFAGIAIAAGLLLGTAPRRAPTV